MNIISRHLLCIIAHSYILDLIQKVTIIIDIERFSSITKLSATESVQHLINFPKESMCDIVISEKSMPIVKQFTVNTDCNVRENY